MAHEAAAELSGSLKEGVYAGVLGPEYETPAYARFLRNAGADAVGMSTVLEAIAARSLGLEVLGISVITNLVGSGEVSHEEVLQRSREAGEFMANLIDRVLAKI